MGVKVTLLSVDYTLMPYVIQHKSCFFLKLIFRVRFSAEEEKDR